MEKLRIFTDGGCISEDNKKEKFHAATALIVCKNYDNIYKDSLQLPNHTHNYGEIEGIRRSLEFVKAFFEKEKEKNYIVEIYSDSMLYVNSLNVWIYNWLKKMKNGVIYTSTNQPVINQESILAAHNILIGLKCEKHLYHINSHLQGEKLKHAYDKFIKRNKCKISFEDFVFAAKKNDECDKLVSNELSKY